MRAKLLLRSMKKNRYAIMMMLGVYLWWSADAMAGRIIMKDGSVEESDKIWETEKYIHFILKGTQSVEIRFKKEIVQRVESESISNSAEAPSAAHVRSEAAQASGPGDAGQSDVAEKVESDRDTLSNSARGDGQSLPLAKMVPLASLEGIQFYDPRRPKKYWVGPTQRYDTLNAALKALAVHYNTTVQWVENHMGNTNTLAEIHTNIRNGLQP